MVTGDHRRVHESIKEAYRKAATSGRCCESECCRDPGDSALQGQSLGCGDAIAFAGLSSGQDVLDIGCGAGIEVIEAARLVGPEGIAYGLDMTDEMLQLCMRNRESAGVRNAVFLRGTMEDIPLPSASVDVVISNCVINLSPDKTRVISEMFRVLRPGGRIAVFDTVTEGVVPAEAREDMQLWCQCLSGAMTADEYREKLVNAGFLLVNVETGELKDGVSADEKGWSVRSALITAEKPAS